MEIEKLHELLDALDSTIELLANESREYLEPTEAGELCLILGDIMGWGSAYASELPKTLGVPPTTVSRFIRLSGKVSTKECRLIADRLRTYLKSLDQRTHELKPPQKEKARTAASVSFDVPAQEWRVIDPRGDVKLKIAAVASILESIVHQTQYTNCPESDQALTPIEKQQLIIVLETALNILRSPMVEKGILTKAREMLRKTADEAAKRGVQKGLGEVAQNGVEWLGNLIETLFSSM